MKISFLILILLLLASCSNHNKTTNEAHQIEITEGEGTILAIEYPNGTIEARTDADILISRQTNLKSITDSLLSIFPNAFKNKVQAEDFESSMVDYLNRHKNKKLPIISDLYFKFNDMLKNDESSMIVSFYFGSLNDNRVISRDFDVSLEVLFIVSRDVASKLTKDKLYQINGNFICIYPTMDKKSNPTISTDFANKGKIYWGALGLEKNSTISEIKI